MLTWIRFWPMFVVPVFVLNAIGFLPTIFEARRYWGGGPVRQWMLNTFLIPLLSDAQAHQITDWFNTATVIQECLMYSIIILNLNLLVIPILYGCGNGIIKVINWISVRDLELKREAVR